MNNRQEQKGDAIPNSVLTIMNRLTRKLAVHSQTEIQARTIVAIQPAKDSNSRPPMGEFNSRLMDNPDKNKLLAKMIKESELDLIARMITHIKQLAKYAEEIHLEDNFACDVVMKPDKKIVLHNLS